MSKLNEAEILFKRLDVELLENIESQYFSEPREFRSLIEVLGVLGSKVDQINVNKGEDMLAVLKDRNVAYSRLLNQRKMVEEVIEEVVKFQHGGLNNSVDTMSEVVKEYSRGRDDIQGLRKSLVETQSVLTSKKSGQIPLKELWLKKVEVEEALRIVRELETLKNAPHRVQRFVQQKRYLTAVTTLNRAITNMFSEDLVAVTGLVLIREQLMDLKETLLETCVAELREVIIGTSSEIELKEGDNQYLSDSDDGAASDSRSERSHFQEGDNRSVRSKGGQAAFNGTDTDGHSSSNGVHSSAQEGGGDLWSLDFRDLDEGLETSLVDPSMSGSVFIRLLVKTVSVLCCEDDVERLLLENISKRFRAISVLRLRDHARTRLQQMLVQQAGNSGRDDEDEDAAFDGSDVAIHTRLFADYVASLLDASVLALHRLLYILRLLGIIKVARTGGVAQHDESSQLSYAQRLQEVETNVKDQNKKLLLSLWSEIEDVIVREIKVHLVEQDVESITDRSETHTQRGGKKNPQYGNGKSSGMAGDMAGDDDDEEDDGEVRQEGGTLIFKPTARHAAPLYKKIVNYNNIMNKLLRENGLSADDAAPPSQGPNGALATEKANHQKTIGVLGGRPPNSLTINERMTLAAALTAVQEAQSPTSSVRENKVLAFVQQFLEEELLPVVQSTVNRDMREIQLNNQHFSVATSLQSDGVVSDKFGGNRHSARGGDVPLCFAAELCNRTSQPLFDYWLQLAQHRHMVAAILENLVRGFASAARDEFEGLTYQLLSQQPPGNGRGLKDASSIKRSVIAGMVRDPLFVAYRSRMYGGKSTAEELVVGMMDVSSGSMRHSSRRPSRSTFYENGIAAGSEAEASLSSLQGLNLNALELACWDGFWEIVRDFSTLSTIASIAYGCDWLVRRLSSMCNATTRKVLLQSNVNATGVSAIGIGPGNASPSLTRATSKSYSNAPLSVNSGAASGISSATSASIAGTKAAKMEVIEARNTLITCISGGTKELSNIAEECIGLLRGELEIVCFYFLSSLAHIKFAKPAAALPTGSVKKTSPKVAGDGSYGRSRQSFIVAGGNVVHTGDEVNSEEEVILSAFSHYLAQYVAAVSCCTTSSVLAVVFSPLCSIIPRVLMKCAMHIILQNKLSTMESQASSTYSTAATNSLLTSSELQLKTRLLRIVVAVQQSTSVSIQSSEIEPEAKRKLQDVLTEEFERLRRYITLFDMPLPELKVYLRGNFEEYSKEEIKVLWFKSTDRLAETAFEDIWREIESSANKRGSATNVSFATNYGRK